MRWLLVLSLAACQSEVVTTGPSPDPCRPAPEGTLPREGSLPVIERVRTDHCLLEGTDEHGQTWTERCDSEGCTLSHDGSPVCECANLDFAASCAAGFPTCSAWRIFDYGDYTAVDERD
jgi:hypothetical protein